MTELFEYILIALACPLALLMVEPQESDKCSKCKYHINPDYTRCKECEAESEDKK